MQYTADKDKSPSENHQSNCWTTSASEEGFCVCMY